MVTVPGIALLLGVSGSAAQLRLAPVIGDGMVLQRHATVPIWGWADRGDTIVVTFERRRYVAVSDTAGAWKVNLPPLAAGGPYELTIAGKRERVEVRDILVGDVWFAAGQSNMRMEVKDARNAAEEIAAARDPQIRQFKVATHWNRDGGSGAWAGADSAHVGDFTAAGYFFARELRKSIKVPIGLINVAVGGSNIEYWMSRKILGLDADSVTKLAGNPPPLNAQRPTLLYDKMVRPLLPYPVKGILWYQGENDVFGRSFKYRELFSAMIKDWRRAWGLGDLPFLFVQLPSNGNADSVPVLLGRSWTILRESQSMALRLPNTAQIVTIDLGEAGDLHPANKQDVGARLALAARRIAYGEKIEHSGPVYRRHTMQNGRAILEFDHVGRGLMVGRQGEGRELQGFAIAGADRQFVWARAKIDGRRVVVWSDRVPQPVVVRYAWAENPDRVNLYNRDGLPAAPFRTDE